ncbi:hypothetical protein HDU98_003044 [Podochytrium sp. JEL0797]|nr:hypothetical protein HDU98_003044 [Podochytrium sp. JEL0797]
MSETQVLPEYDSLPPSLPMAAAKLMVLSQPDGPDSVTFSDKGNNPIYSLLLDNTHPVNGAWFLEPTANLLKDPPSLPRFHTVAPDLQLTDYATAQRLVTLLPYAHDVRRYGYKIFRQASPIDRQSVDRSQVISQHMIALAEHERRTGNRVMGPVPEYNREQMDNSWPLDEGKLVYALGLFFTERGKYQWLHNEFLDGTLHRQDPMNAQDDKIEFKLYFTKAKKTAGATSTGGKMLNSFLSGVSMGHGMARKVVATFTTSKSEAGLGGVLDYWGEFVDDEEAAIVASTAVAAMIAYKFRVQRYRHKQVDGTFL